MVHRASSGQRQAANELKVLLSFLRQQPARAPRRTRRAWPRRWLSPQTMGRPENRCVAFPVLLWRRLRCPAVYGHGKPKMNWSDGNLPPTAPRSVRRSLALDPVPGYPAPSSAPGGSRIGNRVLASEIARRPPTLQPGYLKARLPRPLKLQVANMPLMPVGTSRIEWRYLRSQQGHPAAPLQARGADVVEIAIGAATGLQSAC